MNDPAADVTALDGRTLALLLCGTTEGGEDDWAVFPGVIRLREGALYLQRSGDQPDLEILPEWHERIRPTKESVRQIFQGADYYLALSVGNISNEDAEGFQKIALKWPS
jgi:hypothetical protein